ncbi:MAG: hypothetical protein RL223_1310 [Pseudomonadota bacterium]
MAPASRPSAGSASPGPEGQPCRPGIARDSTMPRSPSLPAPFWWLVLAYFVASLAHFAHNAEYIAFYPGMPAWLTRGQVYLAWLAVTGVGAVGIVAVIARLKTFGLTAIGVYGGLGLAGLAHYTLALCSEHTLATNITIGSEATLGLLVLLAAAVQVKRRWADGLRGVPA